MQLTEEIREMRLNGLTEIEIKHIKQLYETRLKADMVAMLEEIDLQLDDKTNFSSYAEAWEWHNHYKLIVSRLIQEKINALKENKND